MIGGKFSLFGVYCVNPDDYLGYHAELPGKVDRTTKLTTFVQQMITG